MFKLAALTLAALTLSTTVHADVNLKLGTTERVTPVSYTHLTLPTICSV